MSLLDGRVVRLQLKARRCNDVQCARYHQPYRPEGEGHWALPGHEFGLEVIAWVWVLRYRQHRSVPEIHTALSALTWHNAYSIRRRGSADGLSRRSDRMTVDNSPSLSETSGRGPGLRYRPGDLVVSARGYPTLFEVISVCDDGLLRLRGVDWAPGYSALVAAGTVRPTSGILHEE